ncbi:unnamed protein product, partial [Ectocarpus fasciculatus]
MDDSSYSSMEATKYARSAAGFTLAIRSTRSPTRPAPSQSPSPPLEQTLPLPPTWLAAPSPPTTHRISRPTSESTVAFRSASPICRKTWAFMPPKAAVTTALRHSATRHL